MSIIPKINVGLAGKKRSQMNLDFDNSTTLNIGVVQPTMCREMVPNETFKVKVNSLVRLAPMPVPTFARMSLRHYHTFVPYSELWQPFTAMLSGQSYTNTSGSTFLPKTSPVFDFRFFAKFLFAFSDITVLDQNYEPIVISKDDMSKYADFVSRIKGSHYVGTSASYPTEGQCKIFDKQLIGSFYTKIGKTRFVGSTDSFSPGVLRQGGVYFQTNSENIDSYSTSTPPSDMVYDPQAGVITFDGADFVINYINDTTETYLACKLKTPFKTLRSIFLGLGYPFTLFTVDTTSPSSKAFIPFNSFKLLAFYKSWFELFSPTREKTFNETNCYKLIKYSSGLDNFNLSTYDLFESFLLDLMVDCYYYLPMDYFSMSVDKPYDQFGQTAFSLNTGEAQNNKSISTVNYQDPTLGKSVVSVNNQSNGINPLVMRLANRLLTFAGKNTVVGRQIQDYIRVHYGITGAEHHADDSTVYKLGSSRIQINVSDVMSTADTDTAKIGDYAGKGIGYGESDITEFTAKEFGCWITLSVIVPESGYCQGYLLENRSKNRFDYFAPEFDSLGYQVLERGELLSNHDVDTKFVVPSNTSNCNVAFGYVPRYSHYKVSKNILNGDLSLKGSRDFMLPYSFDRFIPTYKKEYYGLTDDGKPLYRIVNPDFIPSVIFDGFRRIDPTDRLGNYNRIFNYLSNDVDHFILHNIFNVTAIADRKSVV